MFSKTWALLLALTGCLWVAGCGGGGDTINPAPVETVHIDATPGVPASAVIGDMAVEISPDTFTQAAEIEVKRYQTPIGSSLPSDFSPLANGSIEITCNQSPQGELLLKLNSTGGQSDQFIMVNKNDAGQWVCLNKFESSRFLSPSIVIDTSSFIMNGGLSSLSGLIGMIDSDPYKRTQVIQYLDMGDNAAPQNTAVVLIHGWNGSASQMEPLAEEIARAHLYQFILILEYDSRRPCIDIAGDISYWLNMNDIKTDIVAHSMGAAVTRFAMEKFGLDDAAHNFYSVCGANEGSVWPLTELTEFTSFLRNDYLNERDALPGTFPINVPASARDLCSDSGFVTNLNTPGAPIYNTANYFILRGNIDSVVGIYSAEGRDIGWNLFTTGSVSKHVFAGQSHSSMIDTPEGRSLLVGYIRSTR